MSARAMAYTCRVCAGSGLLQHPGGPEYATDCDQCENDEMQQEADDIQAAPMTESETMAP